MESFDIGFPESAKTRSAISSEVVASSIEILTKLLSNQLIFIFASSRRDFISEIFPFKRIERVSKKLLLRIS